ncbi:MAG: c-type cytochrome, partial [Rhodospirillales bacterium]|nr:c-type cytochrome [Rhodospirillales bacterium]
SIVRGGRLYDNWYTETMSPPPATRHPAYPAVTAYAYEPGATWRCKECHGWDYRGADGAYSKGSHATGIKGIRALAGADPERVVAILKDDTHGYTQVLGEGDLRDLAIFVVEGQVDMDWYIDRATKKAKGEVARSAAYYKSICATCHGIDGQRMRTMPSLGRVAKSNPWESLHKILNGHPDESMPALRVLEPAILADILAYTQTLPAR